MRISWEEFEEMLPGLTDCDWFDQNRFYRLLGAESCEIVNGIGTRDKQLSFRPRHVLASNRMGGWVPAPDMDPMPTLITNEEPIKLTTGIIMVLIPTLGFLLFYQKGTLPPVTYG